MNIKKSIVKILILLTLNNSHASDYMVGERDFDVYYGPNYPYLNIDHRLGKIDFKDDKWLDNYFMINVSSDLVSLNSFYDQFVLPSFTCAGTDYQKNTPYMHFLNRLTAITLNYDFLKTIHIALYQINEAESKCALDYEQLFSDCAPKSEEMKKFIARAEDFFPDIIDWGSYPLLRGKASYENLKSYHGESIKLIQNTFFEDSLEQNFLKACQEVKKEIRNLCNEKDFYFGLSKFDTVREFLISTSAFKVVNKFDSGEACLDQFISNNKEKEVFSDFEEKLIKTSLAKKTDIADGLFWYGSLKEFDDLGVAIVKVPQKPIVESIVIEAPKPEVIVAKVEPVVVAKVVPKVEQPKIEPKKVEAPKKSAFQLAYEKFNNSKRPTEFDMSYMRSDFKYTKKILQTFNGPLRPYQTRRALTDMKKIDKLGTEKSPLSYLFLRFLVDHNLHQGLYNIKAIIGDEFYVVNDVENTNQVVKLKIENSEKTKFKWQLWMTESK